MRPGDAAGDHCHAVTGQILVLRRLTHDRGDLVAAGNGLGDRVPTRPPPAPKTTILLIMDAPLDRTARQGLRVIADRCRER